MIVRDTIYQRKVKLNVRGLTDPDANAHLPARSTEHVTGTRSRTCMGAGWVNECCCDLSNCQLGTGQTLGEEGSELRRTAGSVAIESSLLGAARGRPMLECDNVRTGNPAVIGTYVP